MAKSVNKAPQKKNIPTAVKGPSQKKMVPVKSGMPRWYWLAGILLITFIVYFPSLDNLLTNWDDPKYITDNPLIRHLNITGIKRIFSEIYFGNYQPLHILSYAIEYNFYKLNPSGYHATSLVMHLIATGLVFGFIFLLTESSTIAVITTLLFGIHPMHVESVVWAAERKDLLYSVFFLASLIFYIRYIKSNGKMKYLGFAFLLFALSILSKAMATSLPPVLILIDIYYRRKLNTKLILEKIPFFALAVVFGLISIHAASTTNSVATSNVYSLFQRIIFANYNLLAYIGKLILPIKLSAFYPYPDRIGGTVFPSYFYFAPVLVIAGLFLAIRSLKKTQVYFFATGFYITCIFLVLQLLPVGPTIMAERYSYLPSIGFFLAIAYAVNKLVERKKSLKTPVYAALAGYSLFLSIATYKRCDVWQNSLTLWNDVLDQHPYVGIALNNLGYIYGKEMGQLDVAMENFNKSILYEPDYENAYANRGIVYSMRGQFDLAMKDFNKALELQPKYVEALVNRGIIHAQLKEFDKAIEDFNVVTTLTRDDPSVYVNRGSAFAQSGKLNEAIADFNTALGIDPSNADAYYQRSSALYNQKRYQEAYSDVQQAEALGFKVEEKYFETIKQAAGK